MVLVERFTSSTCGPCAANNPTMDAFLQSQDPERITGIRGGNTELAWGIEFQAGDVCVVFSIACYERKVIFKGSGSDSVSIR